MSVRPLDRTNGFTLIELAMVALVVGLIAAIAMPTGNNSQAAMADSAASEVAAALRYARDESMRTGVVHGVRQDSGANRLRLFHVDGAGNLIFDVYHPVSKQPWDIQFDTSPHFRGLATDRANVWRGACNTDGDIAFRVDGTPVCTDPVTTLLEQGEMVLTLDNNLRREVFVDGFTGRVWAQ